MQASGGIPAGLVKKPGRIFYGWWVIGAASSLYAVANGIYWVGFSFYFIPVRTELALSATVMSLAPGLARLVSGLQGPVAGYLVERLGPRSMILFGGALGAVGFILLAFVHSYQIFLIVWLGLIVVGLTGGFDQGIMAVANRWFVHYRARAMSFLWVGIALGNALIVPLVQQGINNIGWREAAAMSGLALLAVLAPAWLVIRNLPESMGLDPDGQRKPSSGNGGMKAAPVSGQPYTEASFTARQGFKTASYWVLAVALGLRVAASVGLMAHFVPVIVWKGQTDTAAALLISIYGLAAIPMCLALGWIGDRWSKQKLTSFGMALAGISLLILIFSNGQLWQLVIFIVLLTLAETSGIVAWALVGDLFGRRAFATLLGGLTMVYSLLSAATPILAGWIFDASGSYFAALVLLVTLYASASLLFWFLPRPKLPVSPATPPVHPQPSLPGPQPAPSAG